MYLYLSVSSVNGLGASNLLYVDGTEHMIFVFCLSQMSVLYLTLAMQRSSCSQKPVCLLVFDRFVSLSVELNVCNLCRRDERF